MLVFDKAAHQYRWNEKKVPHVTGIISPLAKTYPIDPEVMEKARQEGVAIHKTVELHCAGDLDVDGLPEWLKPRLMAWEKFLAETGFVFTASERRVYHEMYGYAGALDLAGHFPCSPAILDIKRSFLAGPLIGVQTAAYKEAYADGDKHWKKAQRWALRLNADGTYNMKQFSDDDDFGVFMACLKLHRFREKHA